MATGDQDDLIARQKAVLPDGWFPSTSGATPVLDALLSGSGAIAGWIYTLLAYVRGQMRIGTSTDGWLDITALDYFGEGRFPRLSAETDAAYAARILVNLLPRADTRAAVSAAIEAVTGRAPRIIEPFRPSDTGVWDGVEVTDAAWDQAGVSWDAPGLAWDQGIRTLGAFYWDVDTPETPFRWTNNERFTAFIDTIIPTIPLLGGAQIPFLDANFYWDTAGSALMDLPGLPPGEQAVLDAISRTKVEGTLIGFSFARPGLAHQATGPISAFEHNFYWNGTSYWS